MKRQWAHRGLITTVDEEGFVSIEKHPNEIYFYIDDFATLIVGLTLVQDDQVIPVQEAELLDLRDIFNDIQREQRLAAAYLEPTFFVEVP